MTGNGDAVRRCVLDRFANTGIRDRITRICTDSTAKFETFVMPILTARLEQADPSTTSRTHSLRGLTTSRRSTPITRPLTSQPRPSDHSPEPRSTIRPRSQRGPPAALKRSCTSQ